MNPFLGASAIPLSGQPGLEADEPLHLDISDEAVSIEGEDGSVVIDFAPQPKTRARKDETPESWFRNLVDEIEDCELARIGNDIVEAVKADEQSRSEWVSDRAEAISMLGLKLEQPRTMSPDGDMAGMSQVHSPILLEATLQFQANARAELLPANGPVKVSVDSEAGAQSSGDAERLEQALNYYLTVQATEYYPDTARMLFDVGWGACGFKKIYRCPLRRRPVSESVDPNDLIVISTATDIQNAPRITHRVKVARSTMRRMQLIGAYRDICLGDEPYTAPNDVAQEINDQQGIEPNTDRPEDQDYVLYECYCELDIEGFEDKDGKGEPTGLKLPYKVTVHEASGQVLEIRRNWNRDDDMKLARQVFVQYTYVEGMGLYGIGLANIMGNSARALTAMTRLGIDNAMFSNFPGFLYAKGLGKQLQDTFRIPAGGGAPIDISQVGNNINNAIMPLPYKDLSPSFMALMQAIESGAKRVGSIAEIQVGEGKQDAPVGTTLALIDQATKIESAVHKGLHRSQTREFQLLCALFREDPMSLWRGQKGNEGWDEARIIAALDRSDISPKADPNTPSHVHRLMKMMALLQLAGQYPQYISTKDAVQHALDILGFGDIQLMDPSQQGAPQPAPTEIAALEMAKARVAQAQASLMDAQTKRVKAQADSMIDLEQMKVDREKIAAEQQRAQLDAETKERLAIMKAMGGMPRGPMT